MQGCFAPPLLGMVTMRSTFAVSGGQGCCIQQRGTRDRSQMQTPRGQQSAKSANRICVNYSEEKNILKGWQIFEGRKGRLQEPQKHHKSTTKSPQKTITKTPIFLKTPAKTLSRPLQKKR
jgi:hypothetical protein